MNATLRLIRFHKPVGTLLLWFPTAFALWIAYHGIPPLLTLFYFFIGTFLMRSAGCVLNDIADRHIDIHVTRTQTRPLTSGEITLPYALAILFLLLIFAFIILMQLPKNCFYSAIISVVVTAIYPFFKRFFDAPQLVLGIAFSMGIPMAYAAAGVQPNLVMGLLFVLNFFWILAYDTLYAMADKPHDIRIGVRSTAILFGRFEREAMILCLTVMSFLWLWVGRIEHASILFYTCWLLGVMLLIRQMFTLYKTPQPDFIRIFSTHAYYGFIMWIGVCGIYTCIDKPHHFRDGVAGFVQGSTQLLNKPSHQTAYFFT